MKIALLTMLVSLLTVIGVAFAADKSVPATSPGPPGAAITGIVGASASEQGVTVVVTTEPAQPGRRKGFWFVKFRQDGTPAGSVLIGEAGVLQLGHKTLSLAGQFKFGWVEAGKGIMVASAQDEMVRITTLLPDEPNEGSIVDFWIVETGAQPQLFVHRCRYVDADGKPFAAGAEYDWLYSYALGNRAPSLEGKVCVETAETRCSEMECAVSGDNVVIWQTVYESEGSIQVIRCAQWRDKGRLQWKDRYAGNDWLSLLVDTSCGSVCLTKEWKNPEDASGILCCVRTDATEPIPVGSYGERSSGEYVQFLRLASLDLWALTSKQKKHVEIVLLDNDLRPQRTLQVEATGFADYVVTTQLDDIYLIFLQHGSLACKKVSVNSTLKEN